MEVKGVEWKEGRKEAGDVPDCLSGITVEFCFEYYKNWSLLFVRFDFFDRTNW